MLAYVKDSDVSDITGMLMDLLDSEGDLGRRAALLATVRKSVNEQLDQRLVRLMFDLHQSGWTQREIASEVCLHPQTVREWLRRYREMKGLPPTSRHQREEMLAAAIELRAGFKG